MSRAYPDQFTPWKCNCLIPPPGMRPISYQYLSKEEKEVVKITSQVIINARRNSE